MTLTILHSDAKGGGGLSIGTCSRVAPARTRRTPEVVGNVRREVKGVLCGFQSPDEFAALRRRQLHTRETAHRRTHSKQRKNRRPSGSGSSQCPGSGEGDTADAALRAVTRRCWSRAHGAKGVSSACVGVKRGPKRPKSHGIDMGPALSPAAQRQPESGPASAHVHGGPAAPHTPPRLSAPLTHHPHTKKCRKIGPKRCRDAAHVREGAAAEAWRTWTAGGTAAGPGRSTEPQTAAASPPETPGGRAALAPALPFVRGEGRKGGTKRSPPAPAFAAEASF